MTVAAMHALAAQGKLDGRFAAVGGYFMQYSPPCLYQPHLAAISGYCDGGAFSDNQVDVETSNGSAAVAPLVMHETAGADDLQSATGNGPAAVVLIVHAADARSWQCSPDQRADCAKNLVIDRVAWINGSEIRLVPAPTNLVAPQEQLVTAYQLNATTMNDVDPRFNGEATGQVWYARTAYGPVDTDGTVGGVTREVKVATSAIVDERTLAVSDKYTPGRVVFDVAESAYSQPPASPQFRVSDDTSEYVEGALDNQTPPVALFPSTYTLTAWLADASASPSSSPSQTCVEQVTIEASSDVAYTATFSKSGCQWNEGTP